jgi:coenzyme F420-reducing hydrogenase beta subunit
MNVPLESVFKKKKECSGCAACANVCPKQAIEMLPDSEGFMYPVIDQSRCIGCRKCQDVCVFQTGYEIWLEGRGDHQVYASRMLDLNRRMESQSGGAFTALADIILRDGGVVYGAAFEGVVRVVHNRVSTFAELGYLKGSKYIQSEMRDVYLCVKEDLSRGRKVLFSGTPCQVAGIRRFFEGKSADLLFLCDLVCHSVASPKIWNEYLQYLSKKHHDKIISCMFRDKAAKGWSSHYESFTFKSGKKILERFFARLFSSHYLFRPSCSVCIYANLNRVSDITLGDFWGIEELSPSFGETSTGVSLVITHTSRGSALFAEASPLMEVRQTRIEDCKQEQLYFPTPQGEFRRFFWFFYKIFGFKFVLTYDFILRIKSKSRYFASQFKQYVLGSDI